MKKRLNKKAISTMIGYVLLIGLVIGIAGVTYQWMKTYVPKDIPDCPDEVSVLIKDVVCDSGPLSFTLKNTGLFSINGYYIKATTSESQELATLNLKDGGDYFEFGTPLKPGVEKLLADDYQITSDATHIYSFEITPYRLQENDEGETEFSICGNAKVKETLASPCVP